MSVLASSAVVGVGVGAFFFGRWVGRVWRERREGWWRVWKWRVRLVDVGSVRARTRRRDEEVEEEQRPLLDAE